MEYLDQSCSMEPVVYLQLMKGMYHNRFRKNMLTGPTTCVWMLLDDQPRLKVNLEHVQFFVPNESGSCWDIGSNTLSSNFDHVTETFLVNIAGHTTSGSIYVRDDGYISTISRTCYGNLGWGSNPTKKLCRSARISEQNNNT